jgi:hypothetical protein
MDAEKKVEKIRCKESFIYNEAFDLVKLILSSENYIVGTSNEELYKILYDYIETCIQNSFPKIGEKRECKNFTLDTIAETEIIPTV